MSNNNLPFVTADEARTKWCPYSNSTEGGDLCIAEECMKWEPKKDFTPCVVMGDVVQESPEPKGRCAA